MADVPNIEDEKLFAIQVGARGDWFDKATGMVCENNEALKQFGRVWKKFAQRLRFPTRARNMTTEAESSYASIGYSAGAADWFRHGNRLRQRGVENIEFLIPETMSG
ncbi:uncharacterized protein CMC5_048020 [Chondromyces crocatus]|uniref:Uncharacterized protein n=2 Tax=Chondromyces crocatus TaxID=52 RepID=A0A0K1EIF8_CHOCO|nr:uncharacterized protein CMC5_048020 [Chondromyces crocatus]